MSEPTREQIEAATTWRKQWFPLLDGIDAHHAKVMDDAMANWLAEHEAAARKPLVEALRQWPCYFCNGLGVRGPYERDTPDGSEMVPKHTCGTCGGSGLAGAHAPEFVRRALSGDTRPHDLSGDPTIRGDDPNLGVPWNRRADASKETQT